MKEDILETLKKLEYKHGFKILFCVESGSRAWGMSSEDSDYDVRFVFYYLPERYYSLTEPVLDFRHTEGLIDMHGMELLKFTKLLLKSNPTAIEWVRSPITYKGEIPPLFKHFVENELDFNALVHHYSGLCRRNYTKYLEDSKDLGAKRYLYACRGWLSGEFAMKGVLPPLNVEELINTAPVKEEQRSEIKKILEFKMVNREKSDIGELPLVKKWLCDFINRVWMSPDRKRAFSMLAYKLLVKDVIGGKSAE